MRYSVSLRYYFGSDPKNYTQHRQELSPEELGKWVEAYRFTHPNCRAISIKVYLEEGSK